MNLIRLNNGIPRVNRDQLKYLYILNYKRRIFTLVYHRCICEKRTSIKLISAKIITENVKEAIRSSSTTHCSRKACDAWILWQFGSMPAWGSFVIDICLRCIYVYVYVVTIHTRSPHLISRVHTNYTRRETPVLWSTPTSTGISMLTRRASHAYVFT